MATSSKEPEQQLPPGQEEVDSKRIQSSGIDLDAWRGDLIQLHVTLDQVVQSFISSQTRQLDAIAAELASQKERIVTKEQRFMELSDSIAGFIESETKRLEVRGVPLGDSQAEELREAYDAELPGPPALHRINRLWRKATSAFEAMKEAKEREVVLALEQQQQQLEGKVVESEKRVAEQQRQHEAEVGTLAAQIEALRVMGEGKDAEASRLLQEVGSLTQQLGASRSELKEVGGRLGEVEACRSRTAYEREVEREELQRESGVAQRRVEELEQALTDAARREGELTQRCADRAEKLEQMRRIMDEQEYEMKTKIERVELYVKERQQGALHAERKLHDAEKMAERWQREVQRLQVEKDKLAKLVLDLEGRQTGQATEFQGAFEQHKQEVAALQDALRQKGEEMRAANLELLRQRDDEYQAKVSSERQREKDRSVALLKRKEQEMQIKEQQLRAARQRIQELEAAAGSLQPSPSVHGSTAASRRQLAGEVSLPPLPLSAR